MPYYKRVNDWVHRNTNWRTFKHSCGAVAKFIPSMIECGFDILNPVQCSAAGMDPETLKQTYGHEIVFWGGGVDTQHTLPSARQPRCAEQSEAVRSIYAGADSYSTPSTTSRPDSVENIVAMIEAVKDSRRSAA
jgi:hypothetical protein